MQEVLACQVHEDLPQELTDRLMRVIGDYLHKVFQIMRGTDQPCRVYTGTAELNSLADGEPDSKEGG